MRYMLTQIFFILDEADITILFNDKIKEYLSFDKSKQCVHVIETYVPLMDFIREPDILDVEKLYNRVSSMKIIVFYICQILTLLFSITMFLNN